jgi:hypothetical protein
MINVQECSTEEDAMFVQVIQGRTSKPSEFAGFAQKWEKEVRPGAIGFLGSTGGVTDDGRFVIVARFEDAQAAKANADRPEQTKSWQDLMSLVDGEPTVRESDDVKLLFDGGSDKAGFVQVMESVVEDRAKAEAMESPEMMEQLRTARPDLLGSLRAWFDGGRCLEVAYFTSEADARKGESSSDFAGAQEDFAAAWGDMSFIDLKSPILTS